MNEFQKHLGYEFSNPDLLKEALTHPSHSNNRNSQINYERMEFLGDSVLSLVVTDMLYRLYPNDNEGKLAKRRSGLVCGTTLAEVAAEINLDQAIRVSESEGKAGGKKRNTNLENALEAVFGAIYLDNGIEAAGKVIINLFIQRARIMITPPQDAKSELQEKLQQAGHNLPDYKVIKRSGSDHSPIFTIEVSAVGQKAAVGSGTSKKIAEQEAAKAMLGAWQKSEVRNQKSDS